MRKYMAKKTPEVAADDHFALGIISLSGKNAQMLYYYPVILGDDVFSLAFQILRCFEENCCIYKYVPRRNFQWFLIVIQIFS